MQKDSLFRAVVLYVCLFLYFQLPHQINNWFRPFELGRDTTWLSLIPLPPHMKYIGSSGFPRLGVMLDRANAAALSRGDLQNV